MRYMTYIGEYYNREKKHCTACHYSLIVYSFKHSKRFYCDLLGWSKPTFLDSYKQELILLLKNEAVHIGISECLYNDAKYRQGRCTSYLPLQVFGNICGASVAMRFKSCSVRMFQLKFVVQVL